MSRLKKTFLSLQLGFITIYLIWGFLEPRIQHQLCEKYTRTLYQMVIAKKDLFSSLDDQSQTFLLSNFDNIKIPKKPYLLELKKHFFQKSSLFRHLWILFSLGIAFSILFRMKRAAKGAWILPCIALCPIFFSQNISRDFSFFPNKETIMNRYINPVRDSHLSKNEKLLKGWHSYLITEWGKMEPSDDETLFGEQLEKGLFFFNVARLKWIQSGKEADKVFAGFYSSPATYQHILYFLWSVSFAWGMNRRSSRASRAN